jgi:hypothetical protein
LRVPKLKGSKTKRTISEMQTGKVFRISENCGSGQKSNGSKRELHGCRRSESEG